jgi:hypothetical protein
MHAIKGAQSEDCFFCGNEIIYGMKNFQSNSFFVGANLY